VRTEIVKSKENIQDEGEKGETSRERAYIKKIILFASLVFISRSVPLIFGLCLVSWVETLPLLSDRSEDQ
jgi:hypothetical protein